MATPTFHPAHQRVYRLVGLSFVVGIAGALAALAFEFLVELAQRYLLGGIAGYLPPEVGTLTPHLSLPSGWALLWIPVSTTIGGLLSGWLVYRWAPEAEGHGTDGAIEAYHQSAGEVRSRIPFIKAVASALTIGSGGVAGREGPTAQISVGLGTMLAKALRLGGKEKRALMLAAMAAGLAAMFRAPLGMAIFSVEILYAGMVFEGEALIYTVIAAVTSYAAMGAVTGWESLFEIPVGLHFHDPAGLVAFAVLGVVAGALGAVLPSLLYGVRDLAARLPGPRLLRPALGGLVVGLLAMAAPEILGTGYGWVELAMAGKLTVTALALILLIKGPAMAITIGSGGSGGVFAPTVTLGAMLGAATGMIFERITPSDDFSVAAFVVVGMAAVFAGAARTPISTLIMVVEMTGGYGLIVPAMLTNVLAYVVQRSLTHGRRYPTLYEAQVESREDSPLHRSMFVRRAVEMIESEHLDLSEVRLPSLIHLLRFGEPVPITPGVWLVAVDVAARSTLSDHTVAETVGRLEGTTAVALMRGDEVLVPRGPTRFQTGDRLLAVAGSEARSRLEELAAGEPEPAA